MQSNYFLRKSWIYLFLVTKYIFIKNSKYKKFILKNNIFFYNLYASNYKHVIRDINRF